MQLSLFVRRHGNLVVYRMCKRGMAVASFLVVAFGHTAFAQVSDAVELAFTGVFLGIRPIPQSGEDWFAAIQTPAGTLLSDTRVEVDQVQNACAGTATRITAIDVDEPLFLVRGLSSFRSGPLDAVFEGRRFLYPAEEVSLRLSSGIQFGFRAFGSAAPAVGEIQVTNYEIRIYRGNRIQTLARFPQIDWDGPPRLVWAGDLDGDNAPDALLDLTTSYAGNLYVLYLSSRARDDRLVERVAELAIGGC